MGMLVSRVNRVAGLSKVPDFDESVVAARGHVILLVHIVVEVSDELVMGAVNLPSQICGSDVVGFQMGVSGGGKLVAVLVGIPFTCCEFWTVFSYNQIYDKNTLKSV